METRAELLGIDMEKLNQERFGSYQHYEMLKAHMDRVREYEIKMELEKMKVAVERRAAEDEEFEKAKRLRYNARRKAIRNNGSKRSQRYQFTDKQMEIALKSIQRHAEQDN